jgi:outer membrane protein OmpA-like peptidoglycan-associated protein
MEVHFGHDFANIRIHDDSIAAQSARSVDARAYTVGRDIVFDAGLYAPDTRVGRHLLAHVVQQSRGGSGLRPKSAQLRVSPPDDEFEREADQAANELTTSSLASAIHSTPSLLQRAPCPSAPTHLGDVPLDPASDCTQPLASASGQRFLFCRDSDVMTDQAETELTALLSMLLTMPRIELYGFASPEGPAGREAPYNLNLSCRRAKRVFDFLVAAGVPASGMEVFKHGGTSTFGSRPQNRAVVIPIEGGPVSVGPVPNRLRVAAVSFLACAGCNPFTDDGSLALSPPATEPPVGTSYRMKHWIEGDRVQEPDSHRAWERPDNRLRPRRGHQWILRNGRAGSRHPRGRADTTRGAVRPSARRRSPMGERVRDSGGSHGPVHLAGRAVRAARDEPFDPSDPQSLPFADLRRWHRRGRVRVGKPDATPLPLRARRSEDVRRNPRAPGRRPGHMVDLDRRRFDSSPDRPQGIAPRVLQSGTRGAGCMCTCNGGVSDVPSIPGMNPGDAVLACLGAGAGIAAASCPTPCVPSGAVCTLPVMPSNP